MKRSGLCVKYLNQADLSYINLQTLAGRQAEEGGQVMGRREED